MRAKNELVPEGLVYELALARTALKLASSDFDESKHPRGTDGRFGAGASGAKTQSGKRVHASWAGKRSEYGNFTAQDHLDAAKVHAEHEQSLEKLHQSATAAGDTVGASKAATAIARSRLKQAQHAQRAIELGAQPQLSVPDAPKAPKGPKKTPATSASSAPRPQAKPAGGATSPPSVDSPKPAKPDATKTPVDRKLTPNERSTIKQYTSASADDTPRSYININRALLGKSKLDKYETSEALRHASDINKAIADSPLPEDKTLYRGATFIPGMKAGQVISSPAILSTSEHEGIASLFSSRAVARAPVNAQAHSNRMIFEIHAPKGTRALDVNRKAISFNKQEGEHLFASGQKFKVKEVRVTPESYTGAAESKRFTHVVVLEPINE